MVVEEALFTDDELEIVRLAFLIRQRDREVGRLEELELPKYVGDVGVSFASKVLDDAAQGFQDSFMWALRTSHWKRMLAGRRRTYVVSWRSPGGAMVHLESDGTYTRVLALDYLVNARIFGRPIELTTKGALYPTNWLWYAIVLDGGPGVDFGLREA